MPKQPQLTTNQPDLDQQMTHPDTTTTIFTCCVCQDDHRGVDPVQIHGDYLCQQCFDDEVKTQFFQTSVNEADHPVR